MLGEFGLHANAVDVAVLKTDAIDQCFVQHTAQSVHVCLMGGIVGQSFLPCQQQGAVCLWRVALHILHADSVVRSIVLFHAVHAFHGFFLGRQAAQILLYQRKDGGRRLVGLYNRHHAVVVGVQTSQYLFHLTDAHGCDFLFCRHPQAFIRGVWEGHDVDEGFHQWCHLYLYCHVSLCIQFTIFCGVDVGGGESDVQRLEHVFQLGTIGIRTIQHFRWIHLYHRHSLLVFVIVADGFLQVLTVNQLIILKQGLASLDEESCLRPHRVVVGLGVHDHLHSVGQGVFGERLVVCKHVLLDHLAWLRTDVELLLLLLLIDRDSIVIGKLHGFHLIPQCQHLLLGWQCRIGVLREREG